MRLKLGKGYVWCSEFFEGSVEVGRNEHYTCVCGLRVKEGNIEVEINKYLSKAILRGSTKCAKRGLFAQVTLVLLRLTHGRMAPIIAKASSQNIKSFSLSDVAA